MNIEGFYVALNVEVKRWEDFRSDGMARLQSELSGEEATVLKKSLQGEFNSHVRRIDSLWRQFSDDHKREKGLSALSSASAGM